MEKEVRIFNSDVTVEKREDGDSREINGVAVVFGQRSQKLGWFYEKIDRNAFDECDMSDVIACRNHDPDKIMARTSKGTLKLENKDDGLGYRFEAPNTTVGNDTLEDIKVGNISHSSFAFTVKEDKWEKLDDQNELRTILKIEKLYDVSPVTNPAYLQTSVEANSLEIAKRSYEEWKKDNEPEPDPADDPHDDLAKGMSWREAKMKLISLQD